MLVYLVSKSKKVSTKSAPVFRHNVVKINGSKKPNCPITMRACLRPCVQSSRKNQPGQYATASKSMEKLKDRSARICQKLCEKVKSKTNLIDIRRL